MFEKKNISNICRVRRFYRRAYIEKHSPILNLKKNGCLYMYFVQQANKLTKHCFFPSYLIYVRIVISYYLSLP